MADQKISALTGATTPLAGTEVLPIVQSGTTKKVSVANLTAGREVATAGASFAQNDAAFAAGKITYHSVVGMAVRGNTGSVFDFSVYAPDGTAVLTQQTGTYVLTAQQDFKCANNLVIGTSGKGIDFSATSGSGTSELLADYEEGTFTPTAGIALSSATGKYTKVGRAVHFEMEVVFPVTLSTAGASLGGLPFTASANNYACAVWTNRGSAIFAYVVASSTDVNLYSVITGGIYDYVDFSADSVKICGTYFV